MFSLLQNSGESRNLSLGDLSSKSSHEAIPRAVASSRVRMMFFVFMLFSVI